MTYRRTALVPREFFHLYNRGADKREIFLDKLDYVRFLELLFLSNSSTPVNIRDIREQTDSIFEYDRVSPLVGIGAYCMMPNHFHILATPLIDGGMQTFMRKLCTGYSMYFNKRYERTGVLFQGRYKSEHVDTDEYLKYLFSYIHLNPVKLIQSDWKEVGIRDVKRAKEYLDTYSYSSLPDYREKREASQILDTSVFPEYFSTKQEVDEELLDWLNYKQVAIA